MPVSRCRAMWMPRPSALRRFMVRFVAGLVRGVCALSTVDLEGGPGQSLSHAPTDMDMPALQRQGTELSFQLGRIHSEVQQGAEEHVAANPAAQIQKERFHFMSRLGRGH